MTHRSNGKHRFPASESISRIRGEDLSPRSTTDFEAGLARTHDAIVQKATEFIRTRPAASLLLAAALGGLVGWFVKRHK